MSARSGLAERAAISGQDLGLLSVQFGRRKGAPPMMCLTDRDLRLMALLLDVNYLTTSQLVILGWGVSRVRAAQRRLKVLHHGGFLDRFRPICRVGSAEWIYRLSAGDGRRSPHRKWWTAALATSRRSRASATPHTTSSSRR